MSFEKCWIGGKTPKIQRSSCTARWHCERWFWILCSIHWTRIISISIDGSKSHGYHIQIARVRRTSSWRSISLYPCQNGRCSKIIENSKIGMSRHMDSSTTTHMAKIMVRHWRPLERNLYGHPFGRTVMGKTIWESPIAIRLGESFQSGMLLRLLWKRIILISVCGWHQIGWKETKYSSNVERTKQRSWFGRTSIIPWSWKPGMYTKTMWNKQRYCRQLQNHAWIQNFRRSNWTITMFGNYAYFFVVLWHGRVMPRNVWNDIVSWQTKRLNNSTKYQHHVLMTITSKKKNWNPWENCQKCILKIVLKCLYLARIGRPDILWSVNKFARSITKWTKACDKRLSRLISYIHHTREYKQYCHVGNNAKQCRLILFRDSAFVGDLEDSKSRSGGTLCIFESYTFVPISWMCKKQTSVSHSSTESEIISLNAGLRMDGIPALDLWELIVAVLHGNTYQSNQKRGDPCTNLVRAVPHTLQKRKKISWDDWWFRQCWFYSLKRTFFWSRSFVVYLWRQRGSNQDRWSWREEVLQWDMFPEPTEVALDWLLDRINLDPQIQIKYIDTKNQLADILTKGNFTRDEWKHLFVFVQHQPFQFHQLSWSDVEKNARRCRWRMSRSKIKVNGEFGLAIQRKGSKRACLDCIRKPWWNLIWKSNTSELVEWAATKNGEALAHQTPQNGTMTTSGLLKCGNLVKGWEQVRGDL